MNINWKKSIVVVVDIAIIAYLLVAVTAFNKPDKQKVICKEVNISIEKDIMGGFLDANEIKKILMRNHTYPLNQSIGDISTRKIEETLETNPFIDNAECYTIQSGGVCINVKQRMPIIKVMANNGFNYYVDNRGNIMPDTRYVTDLLVATGYISQKYAQKILTKTANEILQDSFWKDQIVQINILKDGTMEVVPRVGDHIVYLGAPENISSKLERLRKFYVYGLNKAGWNKYSYISLEFDNQIICKKNKHKKNLI